MTGIDDRSQACAVPPSLDAFVDHYRGLLLGLMLGDRGGAQSAGEGGALTQVVCFVVDALIRSHLTAESETVPDPLDEVRAGLLRWTSLTGAADAGATGVTGAEATGWLCAHPALRTRRDGAEALLTGLSSVARGKHIADNDDRGAQGMVRVLPMAAVPGSSVHRSSPDGRRRRRGSRTATRRSGRPRGSSRCSPVVTCCR